MKTAESSIKSDLGKFLVELAINKIGNWAAAEVNQLKHDDKFPICLPTSNKSWIIILYPLFY